MCFGTRPNLIALAQAPAIKFGLAPKPNSFFAGKFKHLRTGLPVAL
jgi:hypothetical protein